MEILDETVEQLKRIDWKTDHSQKTKCGEVELN